MVIAVLDGVMLCVDFIHIDDSLVPDNLTEQWLTGLLESKGYDLDSISWICNDGPIPIRKLELQKTEDQDNRRMEKIKNNKTPKEWN